MKYITHFLALLVMSVPAMAHAPALTPQYLTGTWVEVGGGGTCDGDDNFQFTADGHIMVDGEAVPYRIEFQTIVYEGVDDEMVEYVTPVDRDMLFLKGFNEDLWHQFIRC